MACNKNSPDSLCDKCRQVLKQARRAADYDIELCDDCSRICTDSLPNMHCVEATILVDNGQNSCQNCSCRACLERNFLCKNDDQNVNDLQKSWTQLRHNVRQMYRDRLLDNFVTGKGKKIDAVKIKALVYKLCVADANQLYERLECQSREYIMEVKVQLLQILLIPRQIDDDGDDENLANRQTIKNETGKTLMSDITPGVAEHFLKCLVKLANEFLDTLEKMLPLLERLNDHLAKFQVNWLTVNYSLLDEVFFKDPLVRITLPFPQIFPVLYTLDEKPPERKFCSELDHVSKLFDRECTDLREEEIDEDRRNLMQKLFELDSTIFLFDRQMRDARRQMAKFLDEQTKLYHEKLKEKQKMLKEDLEYFKEKRRLLEEYVSKNKDAVEEDSKIAADDDDAASDDDADAPNEDLEAFAEALRTLLCVKRASLNNNASSSSSPNKKNRRCGGDKKIGKIGGATKKRCDNKTTTTTLPPRRKICKSADNNEQEDDSSTSSLVTSSADEDDDNHNVKILDEYKMQVVCRRKTSVISGSTKKVTTKVETTFTPNSNTSKQFFIAHGDWQVSDDPATLLLNLPRRKTSTAAAAPSADLVFNVEGDNCRNDAVGAQNERLTKALTALSACKQTDDVGGGVKSQEKDSIKIERSCSVDEKINNNNNNDAQDHQHCDCCYCEMFGQHQSRLGRDDFMQIRERLRQKLKKNKDAFFSPCFEKNAPQPPPVVCQNALKSCSQNSIDAQVSSALHSNSYQSDQIKGYRGNEDLQKILNFIEGDDNAQHDGAAGKTPKTKKSAKKKQKKIVKKNCHSDENPDEVFAPKNLDYYLLDEVDKEVEYFKKFVSDSCPAKLKKKVCVDSNLLLSKSVKSFLTTKSA